jgi:hypothetical protein
MISGELERVIEEYRAGAEKEIAGESLVAGKFVGPRARVERAAFEIADFMHPVRPFLSRDVGKDVDLRYATSLKIMRFGVPGLLGRTGGGAVYLAGVDTGISLVRQSLVKDLAAFSKILIDLKIGIPDIFKEEEVEGEKRLDIRVYECISCSGLPNIGARVCEYEGGIIAGVLKELTRLRTRATEVRCWASGYTFCDFDVRMSPA